MTRTTFGWQCIHKVLYSVDTNSAVTYLQIKITDAERTEKKSKNVYPVMEVVSVAVKIVAAVVRSVYLPNK